MLKIVEKKVYEVVNTETGMTIHRHDSKKEVEQVIKDFEIKESLDFTNAGYITNKAKEALCYVRFSAPLKGQGEHYFFAELPLTKATIVDWLNDHYIDETRSFIQDEFAEYGIIEVNY